MPVKRVRLSEIGYSYLILQYLRGLTVDCECVAVSAPSTTAFVSLWSPACNTLKTLCTLQAIGQNADKLRTTACDGRQRRLLSVSRAVRSYSVASQLDAATH